MRLLAPGGILYTASCSFHLSRTLFQEMLDAAVGRATRSLTALDVARGSDTAREQVRLVMLEEAVTSPPGTPAAASALLATSISL